MTGGGFIPATIHTAVGTDPSTGEAGYVISGTLYPDGLSEAEAYAHLRKAQREHWPDPAHIAFANLHVNDAGSVEAFICRYGVLESGGTRGFLLSDDTTRVVLPPQHFRIETSKMVEAQRHLRAAWETAADPDVEGAFPLDVTKTQALEGLEVHNLLSGMIQVRARDLLTLVSFLFLRDATAGRLGICESPECPAPYFRKKRKTQKFCEAGPCVAFAQRQYSLDWWRRVGKKRREKKAKAQHRSKG